MRKVDNKVLIVIAGCLFSPMNEISYTLNFFINFCVLQNLERHFHAAAIRKVCEIEMAKSKLELDMVC